MDGNDVMMVAYADGHDVVFVAYTGGNDVVSGFDWHPAHHNRMLTVNTSGQLRDVTVVEKIAIVRIR